MWNKSYWLGVLALGFVACKGTTLIQNIEKPSFDAAYQSKRGQELAEKLGAASKVTFKKISEKPSSSVEVSNWFADNKLSLPAFPYHDGAVLQPLKKNKIGDYAKYRTATFNKKPAYLAMAIEQENWVFLIYGNPPNEMAVITDTWALIVRDKSTGAVKYSYDFTEFGMAPEFVHRDKNFVFQDILWAQIEDGVLYVSHAHWTYAESSKFQNAYITALDVNKGTILWRSQPLVANSVNFALHGNHIIAGYGFTLENEQLYALDKNSGAVVGSLELQAKSTSKKFIEYIIPKGNSLYIHAHDKQYVVEMVK
jgi:hypothetical protein